MDLGVVDGMLIEHGIVCFLSLIFSNFPVLLGV